MRCVPTFRAGTDGAPLTQRLKHQLGTGSVPVCEEALRFDEYARNLRVALLMRRSMPLTGSSTAAAVRSSSNSRLSVSTSRGPKCMACIWCGARRPSENMRVLVNELHSAALAV